MSRIGRDDTAAGQFWPIGAATALALAIGLWRLGHNSLSLDEGHSAYVSTRPLHYILSVQHGEPNNAFYFGLLFLWEKLGSSDAFMRLLSVLAYVAAVPLTAAIAWRSFGRQAGMAAGFLLAVNAFAVAEAQNARAFALVMALVCASTLCFLLAVERSTWRRWTAWVVLSALAVYAFPTALFVMVAQAISLAWLPGVQVPWRQAGIAAAALSVAALPLLVVLATSPTGRISWVESPNARVVSVTLRSLSGGYPAGGRSLIYIYGALTIVAAVILLRHRPRQSEWSWHAVLPILWLIVPLGLALAVSLAQPIFLTQYLVIVVPAFAIVAAGVLSRLRPWPLAAVAVAAVCVLHLPELRTWYEAESNEDFRGAAQILEARAGTGEIVLVSLYGREPLSWYLHRDLSSQPEPGKITLASDVDAGGREELSKAPERLWLVERQEGSGFDEGAVRWLTAAHPVLAQWNLHRVRVRLLGS